MINLIGKFNWYTPYNHTLVCPHEYDRDPTEYSKFLDELGKLGCEVVGEIEMPLPFSYRFPLTKLPSWLSLKTQEDDDFANTSLFFVFVDQKQRPRMNMYVQSGLMNTKVFTKYYIDHSVMSAGEFLYCVIDLEQVEDKEDIWFEETDPAVLWSGLERCDAVQWLNKNFPDWENPMAYWS